MSLGEGLDAQVHRVDNGRMRWLTVDLPAVIELREYFLTPTARFSHMAANALEPGWMDGIEPSEDIFIVAQGLFMYLQPEAVKQLFLDISKRFPAAEMAFDVIPRWFSWLTLLGITQMPHYRLPPMPWGISRHEIETELRTWTSGSTAVNLLDYRMPRGWLKTLEDVCHALPIARNEWPCLVHIVMDSDGSAHKSYERSRRNGTSVSLCGMSNCLPVRGIHGCRTENTFPSAGKVRRRRPHSHPFFELRDERQDCHR